jgi:hypothetical protein
MNGCWCYWCRSNGKNHARVYSELKSADSPGIYDVNTPAAKALYEKHGATVYVSIRTRINLFENPLCPKVFF